jgi:hypothetical protein
MPSVSLAADGSGILEQVRPGDTAPLSTSAGTTLCSAPVGGGGGSYVCTAGLDLLIPGSVAVGAYSAVLNITIT